tara:strand:+ start:10 stop:426 length:417 start_codon:yes stop_codon:yes gene_type:complete
MNNLKKEKTIILVDMSATLIHHGHIRLLQKASELGEVVIALTTDEEIIKHKGYTPELGFEERKEVLLSIKYVNNVIPSPWLLDMNYFKSTGAHFLVHGNDNSNLIEKKYLKEFNRTEGISSSLIRKRVLNAILEKANL